MRGMKGLSKLVVVAITAATLMLVAAVGASAASGTFGSAKVLKSVVTLVSSNWVGVAAHNRSAGDDEHGDGDGKGKHKCKGDDKDDHHEATPGHKHHPCDDGEDHGGGGRD